MKIIKNITSFNFLNISKYTIVLSLLLMISGLSSLFFKGINVSIDFTGGTVINIKIDEVSCANFHFEKDPSTLMEFC